MKLPLVSALNHVRLRRKILTARAIERACRAERDRLDEMRANAAGILAAQAERVACLTAQRPTSSAIAHDVEMRAKAPLLAA